MTTSATARDYRSAAVLAPHVIRPGRSSLRSTFQFAAGMNVPNGLTADAVFGDAARIVMDWMDAKLPHSLPRQAREMESFDFDHHGQQQASGVSLPEDGLWSVRLVQPDAPFGDRPAVAGRTWTTEIALHKGAEAVRVAVRVLCASAPYATEPITLTRPRVIIDLARKFVLQEIRPLDGQPWMLKSEEDVRALYDLLIDERRTLPIILLTEPDRQQWQLKLSDFVLNQDTLARRTQGMAHVVCMPMNLGFIWTEMVGKVWSAFYGAVRTYNPRVNLNDDSPFTHPRVLAERILFWRYNDQQGEAAFASFLIDKMAEYAAVKSVSWDKCLFFADARSRRAEIARERIKLELQQQSRKGNASAIQAQIDALQEAHEEEIEALRARIAEAQKDVEEFDDLASQYKAEAERVSRENRSLQSQNDALRLAVEKKTGESADADTPIPETYDDMADWVEDHLTGRLILHPRAIQGIKKGAYEDIKIVYKALYLLADVYRNMRIGYDGARENWERSLRELELRFGGSIKRERAGEHGETYFVRYPLGTSQRQFLEFHLRKGSTKDDRYCLGIYFFWDEETQQVVVGWLPSHLETRAT